MLSRKLLTLPTSTCAAAAQACRSMSFGEFCLIFCYLFPDKFAFELSTQTFEQYTVIIWNLILNFNCSIEVVLKNRRMWTLPFCCCSPSPSMSRLIWRARLRQSACRKAMLGMPIALEGIDTKVQWTATCWQGFDCLLRFWDKILNGIFIGGWGVGFRRSTYCSVDCHNMSEFCGPL